MLLDADVGKSAGTGRNDEFLPICSAEMLRRVSNQCVMDFMYVVGIGYPLTVTTVSQPVLRSPADGSFVADQSATVGSSPIGQSFLDARGRPLPPLVLDRELIS